MRTRISLLLSRSSILVAVFLAAFATSALAQAPPPRTIGACYNQNSGNMRFAAGAAECRPSERFVQWNIEGNIGRRMIASRLEDTN